MLKVFLTGRVGKDAEHRTMQNGTDICSFPVACDVGFGDNKSTVWIDVAKFGKGAKGLSGFVRKGDPITVTGDLTTREHDGKTYLNCRADEVAFQRGRGDNRGEPRKSYDDKPSQGYGNAADRPAGGGYSALDDDTDLPF